MMLTPLKAKVHYAESDDEDEDPFNIIENRARRRDRGRAVVDDDDDDEPMDDNYDGV